MDQGESRKPDLSGWLRRLRGEKKSEGPEQPRPEPAWLVVGRQTLIVLITALIVGFIIAWIHGPATPAMLWALALASVGFFIGLLFALPRVWPVPAMPQTAPIPPAPPAVPPPGPAAAGAAPPPGPPPPPGPAAAAAGSYARPTDALLEIADWLTKIIVGLGLVNLKESPALMARLARGISGSLDTTAQLAARRAESSDLSARLAGTIAEKVRTGTSLTAADIATQAQTMTSLALQDHALSAPPYSFGLAMAIFFPVIGLLIGYLTTRMYLQTALLRGDREARQEMMELNQAPGANPVREYQESKRAALELAGQNKLSEGEGPPSPEVVRQLAELNAQYDQVNIPDYRERVLKKNLLTQRMYAIAMSNRVNRGWLRAQDGDGYLHVLATAVLADPRADDAEPLIDRATLACQKHTMYRVVEAVKRLHEAHALPIETKDGVVALLSSYMAKADASLAARINDTRKSLGIPTPSAPAGGG